jgi:Cu2+-exporting ATPase
MHEFYFESAAMIVTLISVGKMLEARAKGKTTKAIKSLMDLAPKMATIIRDDSKVTVNASEVRVGDIYVVRPGERIPVDGVIEKGHTSIDESALSGESIPVDKVEGSQVFAATINKEGYIECKATKVGEDTTLSQIIKVVTEAVATKAPIAKVADTVSGVFVPVVMGISLVTTLIWIFAGESIGFALARGISVLVISCPCALGLATPVAIMVGSGMGAKHGIMFKNAESLEQAGKVSVVALDKTGTITKGEPTVTDIVVVEGVNYNQLLSVAYSLELKSEHPLSKAIISYVEEKYVKESVIGDTSTPDFKKLEVEDFSIIPGKGLCGKIQGEEVYGGNYDYIINDICSIADSTKNDTNNHISKNTKLDASDNDMISIDKGCKEFVNIDKQYKKLVEKGRELSEQGKTLLYFAKGSKVLGVIAVADVIKDDSKQAIKELKELGIKVVMLTGDNPITAKAIGDIAGVDEVIAGVLPDEKAKVIKYLQDNKRVIMVGDGINDAPALVQSDVGIAIGAGTDVAIESADVVLMKSTLMDVVAAIRLSKKTLKNIHENLFWAFIYNVIGIPLAAGVWIPIFGWKLNPMFGAMAMSLSSFCVVSNALRLNLCKMYKHSVLENEEEQHSISEVNVKSICIEEMDMKTVDTQKSSVQSMLQKKQELKDINNTEDVIMKKVIKIEGMMCKHCEARVKKLLEGVDGITEALVSHEDDEAVVTMTQEISNEVLTKLIEDEDYKVIEISVE